MKTVPIFDRSFLNLDVIQRGGGGGRKSVNMFDHDPLYCSSFTVVAVFANLKSHPDLVQKSLFLPIGLAPRPIADAFKFLHEGLLTVNSGKPSSESSECDASRRLTETRYGLEQFSISLTKDSSQKSVSGSDAPVDSLRDPLRLVSVRSAADSTWEVRLLKKSKTTSEMGRCWYWGPENSLINIKAGLALTTDSKDNLLLQPLTSGVFAGSTTTTTKSQTLRGSSSSPQSSATSPREQEFLQPARFVSMRSSATAGAPQDPHQTWRVSKSRTYWLTIGWSSFRLESGMGKVLRVTPSDEVSVGSLSASGDWPDSERWSLEQCANL